MKVVALISGGKDSCYNAMKCVDYGHEIVALANIAPLPGVHDAASYMFQTVGHEAIEKLAECFNLPLYREFTEAKSLNKELQYRPTEGDEVESIVKLLLRVKESHPGLEAVSSGAVSRLCTCMTLSINTTLILSTYQRLRVENAASRTGLLSLSYLWQREQVELLHEMIDRKVAAIIVKDAIAMIGRRKSWIGTTLEQFEAWVDDGETFPVTDVNVCGEGGEYETLVLDCPLFKKRLGEHSPKKSKTHVRPSPLESTRILLRQNMLAAVIDDSEIVYDDLSQTSGYMRVLSMRVEEKRPHPTSGSSLHEAIVAGRTAETAAPVESASASTEASFKGEPNVSVRSPLKQRELYGHTHTKLSTKRKGADGVRYLLQLYSDSNAANAWVGVYYIYLYISDMRELPAVNEAYAEVVPAILPPARACVEVAACSDGVRTTVEVHRAPTELERKVLHVQSISEWAPACIGPYAQANAVGSLVFLAGVLPLAPKTMTVDSKADARLQTQQAIANLSATMNCAWCGGEDLNEIRQSTEQDLTKSVSLVLRRTSLEKTSHIVAFVAHHSDARPVHQEIRRVFAESCASCVVPISRLPRGALVELCVVALSTDAQGPLHAERATSRHRVGAPGDQPACLYVRRNSHSIDELEIVQMEVFRRQAEPIVGELDLAVRLAAAQAALDNDMKLLFARIYAARDMSRLLQAQLQDHYNIDVTSAPFAHIPISGCDAWYYAGGHTVFAVTMGFIEDRG